jgi:tape measure domain-containing protein
MATEHLTVVLRAEGARAVAAGVDRITDSARVATRALRLMQNSLFVIGGAGMILGLGRTLDALTNMQNRLRLVTTSTRQLGEVTQELFDISNRTRSSFEATATIYSRTALSLQHLGVTQQEVLRFTESLNQAVILSGVSAQEAHAGIIQLSQGMASNRLSGDELRSVLEQLPYVADVISTHLGVTRGELKKMGEDGLIAAGDILEAFAGAREELAVRFAGTVHTVGQELDVLKNKFQEVAGGVSDSLGLMTGVAKGIEILGNSLETIVDAIGGLIAAFAAMQVAKLLTWMHSAALSAAEYSAAVQAGTVVTIGSAEASRLKSLALADELRSQVAANVAYSDSTTLRMVNFQAMIKSQQAEVAFRLNQLKSIQARQLNTTTIINDTRAIAAHQAASIKLDNLIRGETILYNQLAGSIARTTVATEALVVADAQLVVATTAANSTLARMVATMPFLAAGVRVVTTAFAQLNAMLGPIGWFALVVFGIVTAYNMLSSAAVGLTTNNDELNTSLAETAELMDNLDQLTISSSRALVLRIREIEELTQAELALARAQVASAGRIMPASDAMGMVSVMQTAAAQAQVVLLEEKSVENLSQIEILERRIVTLTAQRNATQEDLTAAYFAEMESRAGNITLSVRENTLIAERLRMEEKTETTLGRTQTQRLRIALENIANAEAELSVFTRLRADYEDYRTQLRAITVLREGHLAISEAEVEMLTRNLVLNQRINDLLVEIGTISPYQKQMQDLDNFLSDGLVLIHNAEGATALSHQRAADAQVDLLEYVARRREELDTELRQSLEESINLGGPMAQRLAEIQRFYDANLEQISTLIRDGIVLETQRAEYTRALDVETARRRGLLAEEEARRREALAKPDAFATRMAQLEAEAAAIGLTGAAGQLILETTRLELALRRDLTDIESERLGYILTRIEAEKEQNTVLDGATRRVQDYLEATRAIAALVSSGELTGLQASIATRALPLNQDVAGLEQDTGMTSAHEAQLAELTGFYELRQQIIEDALRAGRYSQDEADAATLANDRKLASDRLNADLQMQQLRVGAAEDTAGGLAQVAKTFAGEQSGIYKALFATEKAFAIAKAIMNTQIAVSTALASSPPPMNFILAAAAGAQGAGIVAQLISQTAQGFAQGGVNIGGAGTGTSDSINALLSRGESVVTSAGTRGNTNTLQAMNDGAKFDRGGGGKGRKTDVVFQPGAFIINGSDGQSAKEIAAEIANEMSSRFDTMFDDRVDGEMRTGGRFENVK